MFSQFKFAIITSFQLVRVSTASAKILEKQVGFTTHPLIFYRKFVIADLDLLVPRNNLCTEHRQLLLKELQGVLIERKDRFGKTRTYPL